MTVIDIPTAFMKRFRRDERRRARYERGRTRERANRRAFMAALADFRKRHAMPDATYIDMLRAGEARIESNKTKRPSDVPDR